VCLSETLHHGCGQGNKRRVCAGIAKLPPRRPVLEEGVGLGLEHGIHLSTQILLWGYITREIGGRLVGKNGRPEGVVKIWDA